MILQATIPDPETVETAINFRLWFEAIGGAAILVLVVKAFIDRRKRKEADSRSNVETGDIVTDRLMKGSNWLENKFRGLIADLEKKIDDQDEKIKEHENRIHDLEVDLSTEKGAKAVLEDEIKRKEATIRRQADLIDKRDATITELKATIQQLKK